MEHLTKARQDFKNHTLKIEVEEGNFRSYFCASKEDPSLYWFRIVFAPNFISLYGDVGAITLRPYCTNENSLRWLLGSNENVPYMLEKMPSDQRQIGCKYSPEIALETLQEIQEQLREKLINKSITENEYSEQRDAIFDLMSECEDFSHQSMFYEKLGSIIDDISEIYPPTTYEIQFIYRIAALQIFCELYETHKLSQPAKECVAENF